MTKERKALVEGIIARADPALDQSIKRLSTVINRLVAAVVFGALIAVSALLYVNENPTLAGISLGAALLGTIWILLR